MKNLAFFLTIFCRIKLIFHYLTSALTNNIFLMTLVYGSFILSIISLFIRYDMRFIDSDIMYLPTLYNDLTKWGGNFLEWRLTPAPYYFPDMLIFFSINYIFNNFLISLTIMQIIQIFFYVFGWFFLYNILNKDKLENPLPLPCLSLFAFSSTMIFFYKDFSLIIKPFSYISYHFGIALSTPYFIAIISVFLFHEFSKINRIFLYGLIFIFTFILTASDLLFVVQVSLPCILTLFFLTWIDPKVNRKYIFVLTGWIVLGSVCGFLVKFTKDIVLSYTVFKGGSGYKPELIVRSIDNMRIWIEHSIENNPVAIGIVALSLVVELVIVLLGVYRLLSRKSFPMPVFTICLFIMLSVALNCSAIILVGMFPDPRTSRYIYTLIIISPFFLPFFTVFLERNFLFKIVLSITGVFISISSIIQFDNFKSLKRYSVFYPPVMECLDRNLHTRGLKNGIGNYWDAKYFTMLSRYNLKITQVRDKDILLYHWISNFEWYKRFPPNFIILNTKMSDPHLFIEEDVIKKFGYPNDRFECLNRIVLIYDNLNSTLGTYINKLYLENLKDVDNFSIFKNKSDHCFPKLTASSQLDSFSPDGLLQAIQPGWHSARNPKYPQTITIDFGKTQSIEKIGILPQDQNEKRMPRIIEIRTSDNEKNWVSSGLFDDLCLSGDQDRGDWRIIKFPVPVNGRYLQIKILANCGDPALLTFRGLRVN